MTVTTVEAGPQQVSRRTEVDAPAAEVFAIVSNPQRHHELDGSGTVNRSVRSPARLTAGATFTVAMRQRALRYRITSTVTAIREDALVEWRHPAGHHWRWELVALTPSRTQVTETFDYRGTGPLKDRFGYYDRLGLARQNAAGIEATLEKLQARFAR